MTKPFITDAKYEKVLVANLGKYIAKSDEDAGHTPVIAQIGKHIFEKYLNSLSESNKHQTYWKDAAESHEFQKNIATIPPVYIKYKELISNESVTQFAFSGMGCHYMKKLSVDEVKEGQNDRNPEKSIPSNAVYIHDFSYLSVFRVRQGYEIYGAIAYFNKNHEIIGIYTAAMDKYVAAVKDNSNTHWNHSKWIYKTTVFAAVTMIDHLWRAHHTESQCLYETNIECLPKNHPLRHFIKPFVYRTGSINYLATQLLTNNNGYMERMWALPYSQLVRVFNYATMGYKFRLLPDFIDESMRNEADEHYPLLKDCNEFWGVIRKYVASFLKVYYKDSSALFHDKHIVTLAADLEKHLGLGHGNISTMDRFIDVVSQLICNGTGYHEMVGQTSDYLQAADWVGTKLVKGSEISSVQTYGLLCALSVLTDTEQPRINTDWEYMFCDDYRLPEIKEVYATFHKDLQNLQNSIESRNQTRKYPMQFFNPKHCKCSVSI